MSRPPAFSEALLRAKKAYNAQANREGRPMLAEHDLEEAVWAVYELLVPESDRINKGVARAAKAWRASAPPGMRHLLDSEPAEEEPAKGKGSEND